VSELALEAAKVEQIYEKQQEKRRFARLEEDDLQQLGKNKCIVKNNAARVAFLSAHLASIPSLQTLQ